jgi:large subunit ribosomal protein L21
MSVFYIFQESLIMYAIVEIAGKQFRVSKEMKLKVPLLKTEPGKNIDFERVLAYEDDKGTIAFGTPVLENTNVTAKIIEHGRDKKVIVFKKKRRKGYQKKNGHRQGFSLIEITDIGAAKKTKPVKKAEVTEAKEVAAKKPAQPKAKPVAAKKVVKASETKAATAKPKVAKAKPKAKPAAVKKSTAAATTKSKTKPSTAKVKKTTPKKDVKEE